MTPEQALLKLTEGNERFVKGTNHYRIDPDARASLLQGQSPFATILGCSDARVPVEHIFDQGFDALFIVRVAGNVVGPNELASLLYAALHVRTPLVVVLGHTMCGAITAALAPIEERKKEPAVIQRLLQQIDPALQDIDPLVPMPERVALAAKVNVKRMVNQLKAEPVLTQLLQAGHLMVVGAIYDLHSGKVNFISS
ncbi:carbonic anhydrase [candidate division KSB1 bacterium]|nr:carbonic anhydrase [candidate division KSB1 bacterium]RQW06878.1 MAG: carbonic anhydrase [candidate division KSB1 bacterium]